MPTPPPSPGSARSADELNQLIRAFWSHPDKRLSDTERAEYERLVAEWAAAVREEIVEAA